MSAHINADGSVTEGTKTEGPGAFIAHDLGVTCVASAQLPGAAAAKAIGATLCTFQNDAGSTVYIRFRLDGTSPTASVGHTLAAGSQMTIAITDAVNIKFIQSGATCTVNAWYYQ